MKTVKEKHRGEHRYLVHDNGGRPFLVYAGEKAVTVYRTPKGVDTHSLSYEAQKDSYTLLVKKFTGVQKKFIPKYPTVVHGKEKFERTGNSILLKLRNEYVSIGESIYSFKPKDEIKKYYSFVGNSDVPYPVAVGTENVYFMLERKYIPKTAFPKGTDWEEEAYGLFYDWKDEKQIKKMPGVKTIQKRILGPSST